MTFWTTSDNQAVESNGSFEMGGGEPIPDNTNLKACIDEASWDAWEGEHYIKLRWTVLEGDYKGRKVFQKIKVNEPDISKRDKAIRMLAAIDSNCGGKLMASGEEPTEESLYNLVNHPMIIKVMVWEIGGKSGNWVAMVSSLQAAQSEASQKAENAENATSDDIPF